MQEAMHDTTDLAFNSSRYHGDEYLLVKFFLHPKLDRKRTENEGRPIFKDTAYIQIMQPGNKDSIVIRPATEMDKSRFAEHWKKYLARQEDDAALEGTLLDEWPGVSRAQCEELKYLNVRTVEQLANMSDSNAQNIMGVGILKQKAQDYLEASKDVATQEDLAAANRRIYDLIHLLERNQTQPTTEDLESVDEEPEQAPTKTKRSRKTKAE